MMKNRIGGKFAGLRVVSINSNLLLEEKNSKSFFPE
jgi:hypothetical protein